MLWNLTLKKNLTVAPKENRAGGQAAMGPPSWGWLVWTAPQRNGWLGCRCPRSWRAEGRRWRHCHPLPEDRFAPPGCRRSLHRWWSSSRGLPSFWFAPKCSLSLRTCRPTRQSFRRRLVLGFLSLKTHEEVNQIFFWMFGDQIFYLSVQIMLKVVESLQADVINGPVQETLRPLNSLKI